MAQNGRVYRKGSRWMLQYWRPEIVGGQIVRRRVAEVIATYSDEYRTEDRVRKLLAEKIGQILGPINARTARPESTQKVSEFLEFSYLPHCRETKRPSTAKGYGDMFRLVKPHLGQLQLQDTRTSDVDRLMRAVADKKSRAHTTLRNVKSFLAGAFRFAKRNDLIRDNPVRDSVVPRGTPMTDTPAYTLEEIQAILKVLPEPSRTMILVAALTGLRKSEIKGLRWEDLHGNELHVSRSVWSGKISDTKTLTSRAAVPVLPLVSKALGAHRKRTTAGKGFIFEGHTGHPLRLENVVRRDVRPRLKKAGLAWRGFHAFRRGLGTNLNTLGADAKTIQAILRHARVETSMAWYVKPVATESHAAMKKLEAAFKKSGAHRRK